VPEAALTIDDVNGLSRKAFVAAFGEVFESTPSLAAKAWEWRPFSDRGVLVDAFHRAADQLDPAEELALLQAHPQLASAEPMTQESRREQRDAGLTELDQEMHGRIQRANARYVDRFGFPFIIAVRGLDPADIALALAERLSNDDDQERATALTQVKRIAELRIMNLVSL